MPRTRRAVPLYLSQAQIAGTTSEVESGLCFSGSLDFPHTLFVPIHYTPGYAYPLIVWLHGRGSDQRQLPKLMPLISMRNYVAAAPAGIGQEHLWQQAEECIQQAEQRVLDVVALAKCKFNIHPQRVFLAGFDTGGTMAMRLAFDRPDCFAGVISICGAFPSSEQPLRNFVSARRLGIFLASGRSSLDYPDEALCEDLRLLHIAGFSITVRQYSCGQELLPQMLADVNRWIMERIVPPDIVAVESSTL